MDKLVPPRANDPRRPQAIPFYGQLAERAPDGRDERIAALAAAFERAVAELELEAPPAAGTEAA